MTPTPNHVDADLLQALAAGEASSGQAERAREHLASCPSCRDDLAAWQHLIGRLDELEPLAPSVGFAARVMTGLSEPDRHPATGQLQDFAEGLLGGALLASLEGHLARCARCRTEVAVFERLDGALRALPRLTPAPEFADAVLTAHRIEQLHRVMPAQPSRATLLGRRVRSMLPSPRHRLAAALGLALVPSILLALVVRAVFSHPLVTASSLVSFAWLRAHEALRGLGAGLVEVRATLVDYAWLGLPQGSLAGALTLGSALTLAAGWIVYRNVFFTSASEAYRAES